MSEKSNIRGWSYLHPLGRKAHYFREGRSLCRKYASFGLTQLEDYDHDSPDNCAECRKRLSKERLSKIDVTQS